MSELARICSHDGFIALTTVPPTMHLLGVRARFNDLSAFVMAAEHAGLHFDEMVSTNPRAAAAIGWPLLLAMKLSQA